MMINPRLRSLMNYGLIAFIIGILLSGAYQCEYTAFVCIAKRIRPRRPVVAHGRKCRPARPRAALTRRRQQAEPRTAQAPPSAAGEGRAAIGGENWSWQLAMARTKVALKSVSMKERGFVCRRRVLRRAVLSCAWRVHLETELQRTEAQSRT